MSEIRNRNSLSRSPALGLVVLGLVFIVGYAAFFHANNPSLTIHRHQAHEHEQSREDVMGMIGQLMQRLEQNPKDVAALRDLGRAFMRMQAWAEAERFWNRLLELEPDNAAARQQLAMCLFRLQEFASAAKELKEVLKLDPDNGYALFNLGIINTHYLQDKEQGRKYFQKILDMQNAAPELKKEAQKQLENM